MMIQQKYLNQKQVKMVYNIVLSCGHLIELYNGEIYMDCIICNKRISVEDKIIINIKKITILKTEQEINYEKIKLQEESLELIEKRLIELNKLMNEYKLINENIFLTHNNIKDD